MGEYKHPSQIEKCCLSTKLLFGKHSGKNVYEIIKEDVGYMDWLLNEVLKDIYIDDKVTKMFKEYWERKNESQYGKRNDKNYSTVKKKKW